MNKSRKIQGGKKIKTNRNKKSKSKFFLKKKLRKTKRKVNKKKCGCKKIFIFGGKKKTMKGGFVPSELRNLGGEIKNTITSSYNAINGKSNEDVSVMPFEGHFSKN